MLVEGKTKENDNENCIIKDNNNVNHDIKDNDAQSFFNSFENKKGKKTKLTIKLKSKFQNDNNFFYSILKSNGENITNKDFTQNYSKSDFSSTISDKKFEIESKNLIIKINDIYFIYDFRKSCYYAKWKYKFFKK
jgi:hypothetical protein